MSSKKEQISCHSCGEPIIENGEVLKQHTVLKGSRISRCKNAALPIVEENDKHICEDCYEKQFFGDIFYI